MSSRRQSENLSQDTPSYRQRIANDRRSASVRRGKSEGAYPSKLDDEKHVGGGPCSDTGVGSRDRCGVMRSKKRAVPGDDPLERGQTHSGAFNKIPRRAKRGTRRWMSFQPSASTSGCSEERYARDIWFRKRAGRSDRRGIGLRWLQWRDTAKRQGWGPCKTTLRSR